LADEAKARVLSAACSAERAVFRLRTLLRGRLQARRMRICKRAQLTMANNPEKAKDHRSCAFCHSGGLNSASQSRAAQRAPVDLDHAAAAGDAVSRLPIDPAPSIPSPLTNPAPAPPIVRCSIRSKSRVTRRAANDDRETIASCCNRRRRLPARSVYTLATISPASGSGCALLTAAYRLAAGRDRPERRAGARGLAGCFCAGAAVLLRACLAGQEMRTIAQAMAQVASASNPRRAAIPDHR
jgi:hypothetical protein